MDESTCSSCGLGKLVVIMGRLLGTENCSAHH